MRGETDLGIQVKGNGVCVCESLRGCEYVSSGCGYSSILLTPANVIETLIRL